ncbi:3-phosphoshikimate 1-carboxyvinyltransferase [Sphingobacteriales bacterium UPWRP_1]|nr:hypothetical protein BVG80_04275 [Sphingobacteriales bacterium TSM_CSM]PSJ73488.1 3-phosphoshikimate 1-carboxyvinyltransferase [Sphingobacteriales bacterium UPWRP_1]
MQYVRVLPPANNLIQGHVVLDGSKSISNRALIIRALCSQNFPLEHLSASDDTQALQAALENLPPVIDVGAAGTTMRFLCAYLAVQKGEFVLTGSERMKQRPIAPLVTALQQLGANISYTENEGFPPVKIIGQPLAGGVVTMPANISSQFISALLLIAPTLKNGMQVQLTTEVVSEPYLDMTLQLMEYFGIKYQKTAQNISILPQPYLPKPLFAEADWSAASYYYAMAAFGGKVQLHLSGLRENSLQADSALPQIMQPLGVNTRYTPAGIELTRIPVKMPDAFSYNFLHCPDIAQTLAVVCAGLHIAAQFDGLQTLQIKETDRTAALQQELAKVNVLFAQHGNAWQLGFASDTLYCSQTPVFETWHDHRMAMSFAPLAMILPGGVVIQNPGVVSKSYPLFWEHLRELGFMLNFYNI